MGLFEQWKYHGVFWFVSMMLAIPSIILYVFHHNDILIAFAMLVISFYFGVRLGFLFCDLIGLVDRLNQKR